MARFENRVHDSLESIATFVSDKDVMCKSANTTMVIRRYGGCALNPSRNDIKNNHSVKLLNTYQSPQDLR